MLLILAPRHDLAALSLAERWNSQDAAVLTASDLSRPGWKYEVPARGPSRFFAAGRARSSAEISGVLTRLPAVAGPELDHIASEDRSYVSSEMTAFLLAWLSSLACPVLNRPTPGCLCGPNWRIEQWIHLAAGLGISVDPVRRSTSSPVPSEAESVPVTVVGESCIGAVHSSLAANARRLAAAAQVDLLEVRFNSADADARLQGVNLCPDVSQPEIAGALLAYFDARVQRQ